MSMQGRRVKAAAAVVAVVVAAVAGVLIGRGLGGSGAPGGSSSLPGITNSQLPGATHGTSPGLKPEITGLLDRGGVPSTAELSLVQGFVTTVRWADLQPVHGGPIAADNVIDRNLAALRVLNALGSHLEMKIRVVAGLGAPEWAKQLGGAPVTVVDPQSGRGGTVGRFWTAAFGAAWAQFMTDLAAKYDGVPEIRDVTISRCTTVYAEPLIRNASSPTTVRALLDAGYTSDADEACQRQQVDEAGAAFHLTHLSLSLNPYQRINADGSSTIDEGFTEQLMDYCRTALGKQCVLENNSIRTPPPPGYARMYAAMVARGGPISFQTASSGRIGDLQLTLQWAVAQGAGSVELPSGFQKELAVTGAGAVNAALAAHQH